LLWQTQVPIQMVAMSSPSLPQRFLFFTHPGAHRIPIFHYTRSYTLLGQATHHLWTCKLWNARSPTAWVRCSRRTRTVCSSLLSFFADVSSWFHVGLKKISKYIKRALFDENTVSMGEPFSGLSHMYLISIHLLAWLRL